MSTRHQTSQGQTWTPERKQAAAISAPRSRSRALLRRDTRVIERPGWYQLVTPSAPGTQLNEVVFSQVDSESADRVIEEVIALYRADGHPVKWCVGPWTEPADFGERLTRRGFTSWEVRGMVAETSLRLAPAEGVTVGEVGEERLEEFVRVMSRGWSLPAEQVQAELEIHQSALRASPSEAAFFAARVADELVGTTGLLFRGDYGYLVGAQVLPSHRGRGIYRALVAARLATLAARGLTPTVTQAREATSASILEHLGFETVFRSRCYLLP